MPFRLTIRNQLRALVLAIALPSLGLVGYNLVDAANEVRQAADVQVRGVAQEVAGRLELVLRDNEALLAGQDQPPRYPSALDEKS